MDNNNHTSTHRFPSHPHSSSSSSAPTSSPKGGKSGKNLAASHAWGYVLAIVSGASFGLIPLFSIPVIATGMGYVSIIFYRFLFGAACMLAFLLYRQVSLRITWRDFWRISLLSLLYIICAVTLFVSYDYISSGVSTSLIYTNPIWCTVIGLLFLGERLSYRKCAAIVIATLGVMLLTGFFDDDARFSAWGIFLGLCSGIGYGAYLVLLPRLKINKMPSLKLTFYIFFNALLYLLLYAIIAEGGIEPIADTPSWVNLLLLGILPTAFSNICVTMSLRLIDTTIVAILGAFEPLTAMVVGVILLGEPCGIATISGGMLILIAVAILTLRSN